MTIMPPLTPLDTATLTVRDDGGVTRLVDLYQAAPLRLLFPASADPLEPMVAILVNTAGGLVGGDRLMITVEARAGARLLVMAQAAEKLYGSAGADVRWDVTLKAEADAWLEWLPQETIAFDGARLRRRTRLDLARNAQCLAGEMLVLGRAAHDETFNHGLVRDGWEVRLDGRLVWADALHLEQHIAQTLSTPSGFCGAHSCATLVAKITDPLAGRDALRAINPPENVTFGVTVIEGLLIARWLGVDVLALREHYGAVWRRLRRVAGGLQETLPRLWSV